MGYRGIQPDLVTLRRIAELLSAGLNLSGIGLVLVLEKENETLRTQLGDQAPTEARHHSKSEKRQAPLRISESTPAL